MANKKSSNKKNKKKFKILKKIARGIYYIISRIYNVIDKTIIMFFFFTLHPPLVIV